MAYLCIFLALFQNIQSTCSGNLPEPLKLRMAPLYPRIAQHCVPSQRSLLTLHNFLGSLHIRPICLTWNNGTGAPDMPCCCGPWLTIRSPVMQKSINLSKSTKPLPPHRIYSLHTQCLGMATNNPLLSAILWTSCYFSSQSRLSSLAHWLIVEGEPLQGLQRIGRSWHLPRVDQVSSGHLP